jgi:Domain of unknown function (DUF4430)
MRSLTALAAGLVCAAMLVPSALAVGVHVRVEGKTTTIFGATEPRVNATSTVLDALEAASVVGEFYYHVRQTALGPFVDQIGRYPGAGFSGWTFKVNGVSAAVGADKVTLKESDRVLWYWATFSERGGPPTLLLRRRPNGCYQVLAQDDAGKTRPGVGAFLHVDGRRLRTTGGRACAGAHRGLVRATLTGAVRSAAVR